MVVKFILVLVTAILLVHGKETETLLNMEVIAGEQSDGYVCPQMQIEDGIKNIRERVKAVINFYRTAIVEECGDGLWYRVANLNMTDPSEQCPSAWREYHTSGIRACGRPVTSSRSCPATTYSIGHPYSKVCGRVIGYQVASPDAFNTHVSYTSIDHFYADGISITHRSPRKYIWTYVGGLSEASFQVMRSFCPCQSSTAIQPPSFVGNNYYCETGNLGNWYVNQIFNNDKLWDGKQCENEGSCCGTTKSPPWFSVELSNVTTDNIEVRICGSEGTSNEDTPIELLQIYIQ